LVSRPTPVSLSAGLLESSVGVGGEVIANAAVIPEVIVGVNSTIYGIVYGEVFRVFGSLFQYPQPDVVLFS
jgi:hypothetical protein